MDNNKLREMIIDKMKNGEYELKPCPFCGSQPVLEDREMFEKLDHNCGGTCITIECHECNLDFYDHTHDEHDYFVRAFLVTEKWNRRAE